MSFESGPFIRPPGGSVCPVQTGGNFGDFDALLPEPVQNVTVHGLADAFEALLAAVYLDAGDDGMEIISAFLLPMVKKDLSELESKGIDGDYKTPLQQLVQQTEGDVLEYILIRADGPDHQKTFEVEVRVNSNPCGRGVGTSKRKAEQAAAKAALKVFGIC